MTQPGTHTRCPRASHQSSQSVQGGLGWLPRGLAHSRCTMGVWSSFRLQLSPPPTPPTGTLQHPQALTVR